MNYRLMASLISALAASSIQAATLEINATTSSIQHFFSPGGGYENLLGSYYGGDSVPGVTGRFANYDHLKITLSAPSGFEYVVDPVPEATSIAMHVGLFYNYAYSGGPIAILPTTVQLTGYNGPSFTNTVEARAFYGGQQFYAEGWLSWSGWGNPVPAFSFSSLVIEADLSQMAERATDLISYQPSFGSAIGILTYTPFSLTTDPGPMVRLAPVATVPEPNSLLLFATGLLVFLIGKRMRRLL